MQSTDDPFFKGQSNDDETRKRKEIAAKREYAALL
jgi:hypothetical protein